MTAIHSFLKDPAADLPYALDWSELLPAGETLDVVTWTFPEEGIELVEQSESGTVASIRVRGGDAGERYEVRCHVVTTPSAYEDERTIAFRIEER